MSDWTDSPNAVQKVVRKIIATKLAAWALARTIHHLDGAVRHVLSQPRVIRLKQT